MGAQRAGQHSAQMAAAAHYHRMTSAQYHGHGGYNVGYNVNVLPFGGAPPSNQFVEYGQEPLHSEMDKPRAPEQQDPLTQLDADAWEMVTEMVQQSKVEEPEVKEEKAM